MLSIYHLDLLGAHFLKVLLTCSEGCPFDSKFKGFQTGPLSLLAICSLVPLKIECPSASSISPLRCDVYECFSASWQFDLMEGVPQCSLPPLKSCRLQLSAVCEREIPALSLVFILFISSFSRYFFSTHHCVLCALF